MARIVGFRRPRPIPEVESQIAHLTEELSLTASFVAAMERQGQHRAVLGVLEEQQSRLAQAERVMVRELGKPRSHRIHAAMAGVAAVLMFASGAFAGFRAFGPTSRSDHESLIRSASVKLAQASETQDPTQVAAIVDAVHQQLSSLEVEALDDTETREGVTSIIERELAILAQHAPHASALVQRVRSMAQDLNVEVEAPAPSAKPAPKEPPAPPSPEAP